MKKGRSTYTFKINNNAEQLNALVRQFISANNFVQENKNGELYYKSGDAMMGYKYFNYLINGDTLVIYAWLKNFSTDVEVEQDGLTSVNMSVMGYRNLLSSLFTEIDKLNNATTNFGVVNTPNTNNITGYNPNIGDPAYVNTDVQQNANNGNVTGYNPNTGEPIYANASVQQNTNNGNITGYNPNTGEPIYGNKNMNSFSNQFQNANTKRQETMCEVGFWISIFGLFAVFSGVTWGAIVYMFIFYFASQGLKTRKKNKAIATIVISTISIIIVFISLIFSY